MLKAIISLIVVFLTQKWVTNPITLGRVFSELSGFLKRALHGLWELVGHPVFGPPNGYLGISKWSPPRILPLVFFAFD